MARAPLDAIRSAVETAKKVCSEKTLASVEAAAQSLSRIASSIDEAWLKPLCPSVSRRATSLKTRIESLKARLRGCLQVTSGTLVSCAEVLDGAASEAEKLVDEVNGFIDAFDLARSVYETAGTVDARTWVERLASFLSSPVTVTLALDGDKIAVKVSEPQVDVKVPQELSCLPDALVEAVLREAGNEAPLLLHVIAGSLEKCMSGTPDADDILACALVATGAVAGTYARGHLVVTVGPDVSKRVDERLREILGSGYTGKVGVKGGSLTATPTIHYDVAASTDGHVRIVLRDMPLALAAADTSPLIEAATAAYNRVAGAISKAAETLDSLEDEYRKVLEEYGEAAGGTVAVTPHAIAAKLLERGEKIDVLLSRLKRIEEGARLVLDAIREVQEAERE